MHSKESIQRQSLIGKISDPETVWDIIVIGGGATGLGSALDASSRGYSALLLEQADFAKGTSSRSTKLVHGGVRYLAQGDIALVREALFERGLLVKNAAHLVKNESFIIPCYSWWARPFYGIGLGLYDLLAGRLGMGKTRILSRKEVISRMPGINQHHLYGGVMYHDGQFDDSRLAVDLASTCLEQGAVVLNYFRVDTLLKEDNKRLAGLTATDQETGISYILKSRAIINATGVFVDAILQLDEPGKKPVVRPSQGIHLVVDRSFLPGEDALMIPATEDGRVLFAVPWHERLVIGTTDTPLDSHSLEPRALEEEVSFILRTAARYLSKAPEKSDILSIYAGLRPLAAPASGSEKTKELSRSHKILVSRSGLITITGGKWTTYRRMAEDTVDKAIETANLKQSPCITRNLKIHGCHSDPDRSDHLYVYGSNKPAVLALLTENQAWAGKLHARLPYLQAEVIWGLRHEQARTVEDILARRLRALFLDAGAALEMAPVVASLMAVELGKDKEWEKDQIAVFSVLAKGYLPVSQAGSGTVTGPESQQ